MLLYRAQPTRSILGTLHILFENVQISIGKTFIFIISLNASEFGDTAKSFATF